MNDAGSGGIAIEPLVKRLRDTANAVESPDTLGGPTVDTVCRLLREAADTVETTLLLAGEASRAYAELAMRRKLPKPAKEAPDE